MPMYTTIKHLQVLAARRKVTCALVTTVVGELIGTTVGTSQASHAEQHMVEEGFHLGGSHLGSHLYGDFRARESGHSMFFSVEESIEAITAALNTRAGADALAYPTVGATNSSKVSLSKDWWEYNVSKSDLHIFDAEEPFAPWDLEEHTPMSLKDTWITA